MNKVLKAILIVAIIACVVTMVILCAGCYSTSKIQEFDAQGNLIRQTEISQPIIDLTEKAVGSETTGWGIDGEIPSVYGSDTALCKIKLGYFTTKWSSAPKGGKSTVNKFYDDINIFTLSGSGKTVLSTEVGYTDSAVTDTSNSN